MAVVIQEGGANMTHYLENKAQSLLKGKAALENDLRNALKYKELSLDYQPIWDVNSGTILGFEALIRWAHPTYGFIAPTTFIPIAEESGLITQLGHFALQTACAQVTAWNKQFGADFYISVNLSAKQMEDSTFTETVIDILRNTNLRPNLLELELTEGIAFEMNSKMVEDLHRLHEIGVRLAIDDFGTGYSSWQYLSYFPIDTVKIDRSFIQTMLYNSKQDIIVTSMIELAAKLHLNCIAEGVEQYLEVAFLRERGCGIIQGFHYSKPLSVPKCELYIRSQYSKKKSAIHRFSNETL